MLLAYSLNDLRERMSVEVMLNGHDLAILFIVHR